MRISYENIKDAVSGFINSARLAGHDISADQIEIEVLERPHLQPVRLPKDYMAVYLFFTDEACLKIGKVGPKSNARYTSQHYNAASAASTLAASIIKHMDLSLDVKTAGDWIKANTHRINILVPASHPQTLLSLCEAFMHLRFNPRFEG